MRKTNYTILFCFILFSNFLSAQVNTDKKKLKMHPSIYGTWENGSHFLKLNDDKQLSFDINRSCGFNFPIKAIDHISFEIIWDLNIDCVFDIKIADSFGLKEIPEIGKAFAKYHLINNTLYVEYYYPKWVTEYSKNSSSQVFTREYTKMED